MATSAKAITPAPARAAAHSIISIEPKGRRAGLQRSQWWYDGLPMAASFPVCHLLNTPSARRTRQALRPTD
jgi:hypothetical protein